MPETAERVVRQARYEVPSAAQEALGLWVRGVGMNSAQPPHTRRQNRELGCYAALWISRGRGWFESPPTGRRAIEPGTLAWLFPEVRHSYGPIGEPWAEQWVLFGGTVADAFREQEFLSPARALVRVGEDEEVMALFARLQTVFVGSGPLTVPRAAALTHQLVVAVHGIETGLGPDGTPADLVVAAALRAIDAGGPGALTPARLAARLHVGYSTLRRRFRRQTGYSVKEYILRVQLNRAKELLAFTEQPIALVARDAGFEDPYYFSRLFREREGVPPRVFREHQGRKT